MRPSAEDKLLEILPDELLALLRTLSMDSTELQRLQSKGKAPKPVLTAPEARILLDAIHSRQSLYATTIDQDKAILQQYTFSPVLPTHDRRCKMAIEVRLGEKEILQRLAEMLQKFLVDEESSNRKRAAESSPSMSHQAKKYANTSEHRRR